ncbi:MAG: CDP-alcohol phosphatidyltransferase family protein [bacterium]|nr:CDP-alcohol phosphatidyltransferase family protein [bacterium]
MADALTGVRLLLGLLLPALILEGGVLPLCAWGAAALTDYVDGPMARRRPPTRHGPMLDTAADVLVVLGGLAAAAARGLVSWIVPLAIVVSVTAYVVASWRLSAGGPAPRLARSRIGHWAGVVNYACLGLACGALALPWGGWPALLGLVGAVTAAWNLAAVAARVLPRQLA